MVGGGTKFCIVMSNKAAKAEIKIQQACERLGVSQSGLFWLDHALDPFKDMVRPHPGYPDKNMDPSVVEVVKQSIVLAAPGVANWDASIFLDQLLTDVDLFTTTTSTNTWFASGQGVTPYARGGLVYRTADAAVPLQATTTKGNLSIDSALYANEECRVIGMGFEVHDTTAELYKQGNVVCWRLDQPPATISVTNVSNDNGLTACQTTSSRQLTLATPPSTSAEAIDMMGSVQWEAKEGCYIVPVLTTDTNDALALQPLMPTNVTFAPVIQSIGVAKLTVCTTTGVQSPWSMCGAFFSGLHPSASLTINLIYFLERFPNKTSAIRRLCYPSPPYDDRALTVYSDVARELPVAVMVKDNAAGDWIAGIANIIGAVSSLIPHPAAKTIGMGANFVSKMVPQVSNQLALLPKQHPRVIDVTNTITGERREMVVHRNDVVRTSNGGARPVGFYRPPQKGATKKRVNRLKKMTKGMVQPDNSFKSGKKPR